MEIVALIIVGALIVALGIALAPYIYWILGIGCAFGLLVLVVNVFDNDSGAVSESEIAKRLVRDAEEPMVAKWIDNAPSAAGRRLRTLAVFLSVTCLISTLLYLVA